MKEPKMPNLADKIMKRVRGHGRGNWVCRPKDFLDLGTRAAVDQALSRLAASGRLRRLARGLYDYPRVSRVLNRPVPPRVYAVAAAVAGRRATIMPDGMAAANALGLTNAVPAKASFVTNGHTGSVRVGDQTIYLKKAPNTLMPWLGRPGAPVVQALAWLGRAAADDPRVVAALRARLPDDVKDDLHRGIGDVPGWAEGILRRVVAEDQLVA